MGEDYLKKSSLLTSHLSRFTLFLLSLFPFHLCLINPNSITRHRFKPKPVAFYAGAGEGFEISFFIGEAKCAGERIAVFLNLYRWFYTNIRKRKRVGYPQFFVLHPHHIMKPAFCFVHINGKFLVV